MKMKQRFLALNLVMVLIFTDSVPLISAADVSPETASHIIERVDDTENNGLMRSYFQNESGEEISIQKHRAITRSYKSAAVLPSSYDSRETGTVTPIKDQGVTGGCWAFGAIKSLESSSITKGISALEDTDYSENHLIWYSYDRLTDTTNPLYGDYLPMGNISDREYYNRGGNAYIAMFVLANWWGAVKESVAPFSADTTQELQEMAASMRSQDSSLRLQSDVHLKEANIYDGADISEIKQAVMDNGSLDVALYYSKENMYQDDTVTSAYETTHTSDDANHCVTIIGWDDDFNTFQTDAPGSGAWLIANSYGEDYKMSTDGFYWVSYYDTSLCEFCSFETEETSQYSTNFQYDGMGWASLYYDTDDIRFANVFTNAEDSPRKIEAAGFYTVTDQQPYEIQVYRHVSGTLPTNGELVEQCSTSGIATWAGYHTIPLTEAIAVDAGETFSVVVTFSADNGNEVYVAIEGSSDSRSSHFSSSTGQSYVCFGSDGSWFDNTAYKRGRRTYNMNNVCLKVLANTVSEEVFSEQEDTDAQETVSPSPSGVSVTVSPQSTTTAIPQRTATASPQGSTTATPQGTATVSPQSTTTVIPQSTATASPQSTATVSPAPGSSSPAVSEPPSNSSAEKINVVLKKTKLTLGKGETVTLPIMVSPSSAKKKLSFQSSQKKVVSVTSSGKLTGKKAGKAKIHIRASSGLQVSITVVVKKAPKAVALTARKVKLKKGDSIKLNTRLSSGSASYTKKFSSSCSRIASVGVNGKVKAKRKGITWITVKTYNGKRGKIKIRVV